MGDRIVILTGHPSTVHDVVDVGIPRPRGREAVDSDRFRVVRDYLWTVVMKGQASRDRPGAIDPDGDKHRMVPEGAG